MLAWLGATSVSADIAPTAFNGSGIKPISATGIRMASAKVDIEWGLPCKMSAIFEMENKTSQAIDIALGFPVSLPANLRSRDALDFSMSFDGVPADPSDITEVGNSTDNFPRNTTWYRCRHRFVPGKTTVTVTTKLPASLVYSTPYREVLSYCIETGAAWEGTIGSEEVTIHFPSPITPDQIVKSTPASCTVKDKTVCWEFKNFKPKGQDHDVILQYLRPDVATALSLLRAQVAKDPGNADLKLKLAKNLFALDRLYLDKPDHFQREAMDMVQELLKSNPKNAAVWNFYFEYESRQFRGGYDIPEALVPKIQLASKLCADDPAIQLWLKLSEIGTSGISDDDVVKLELKLRAELQKKDVADRVFTQVDYGYW